MRSSRKRWHDITGVLLLGLIAGLLFATNGANAEPDKGFSVQLVTGDSVSVRSAPDGRYAVTALPTGERNQPLIRRDIGGQQYVIPLDAANQVATGAIDRRLFELDVLAEYGSDVPLLAKYADGTVRKPDSLTDKGLQRIWLDDGTGQPPPVRPASPAAETYEQKFTLLDRTGEPAGNDLGSLFVVDVETGTFHEVPVRGGVGTVELPAGEYVVEAVTATPRSGDWEDLAYVVDPSFQVSGAGELVLDSRKANQVKTERPREGAFRPQMMVGFGRKLGASASEPTYVSEVGSLETPGAPEKRRVFVAPTEPMPKSAFVGWANAFWAKPSTEPGWTFFENTPYLYDLVTPWPGRIPDDPEVRPNFAKVRAEHASKADGRYGWRYAFPYVRLAGDDGQVVSTSLLRPAAGMALPFEREEYYSAGPVKWTFWFEEFASDRYPDGKATASSVASLRSYEPGKTYQEQWNAGVFGPGLPSPSVGVLWDLGERPFARRHGDQLTFDIPMFSDGQSERSGRGPIRSRVTSLYREGELVDRSTERYVQTFSVPKAAATYELTTKLNRKSSLHSSSIRSTWTFESASVPAEQTAALPLLAVRYAPELDERATAPGGRSYEIPITVQRQPGSDTGRPDALEVEVSYDEGEQWEPAKLDRTGPDTWVATVTHPDSGRVSLRAEAADSRGNTVEQTVLGAYTLR